MMRELQGRQAGSGLAVCSDGIQGGHVIVLIPSSRPRCRWPGRLLLLLWMLLVRRATASTFRAAGAAPSALGPWRRPGRARWSSNPSWLFGCCCRCTACLLRPSSPRSRGPPPRRSRRRLPLRPLLAGRAGRRCCRHGLAHRRHAALVVGAGLLPLVGLDVAAGEAGHLELPAGP